MPSIPENPWHDDLLDVPRALWLPHALQTVSRMGLGQELAVTHPGRPAQTVLAQASEALRTGGVGAPVAPCGIEEPVHAKPLAMDVGMTVGLKVIHRKRALMMHMRVKSQPQCGTLLHDPYARVATATEPTLVTFGPLEPPFQIQIGVSSENGTRPDRAWCVSATGNISWERVE